MDKIIEKLRESKHAAIMAHVSEDPDALGSCFAMAEALRQLGNEPVCYVNERPEPGLAFIGGKYTIFNGDVSDINCDLCVCLDCGDRERLGSRVNIMRKVDNSVNIDHHYTNDLFAGENYVDGEAAATGEILYELFRKMDVEITDKIARFLYIAIAADTGSFKYSNVSPKTMRIAADLLERDFDHAEALRLLFDTEPLALMKMKGAIMGNIHSYCGGKVSVICIDEKMYTRYGVEEGQGDFVNIPRRVEGTEIAVCIKRHKDRIKISFRSNGNINVSDIAANFGGGGHAAAAGATADGSLAAVEKSVVGYCEDALKALA
jgi:phosphoesterase RecJ-like protein